MEATVKGWRDAETGLYRIPLKEKVENWNAERVLLDKERSKNMQINMPSAVEAVNNVY